PPGGPQVEDAPGSLVNPVRLLGVVAQVGHHVVPGTAFELGDAVQVGVSSGPLQSVDLLGGDGQPQILLAFGESDPQLPPGAEAVGGGEDPCHLRRGVTFVERVLGRFGGHGGDCNSGAPPSYRVGAPLCILPLRRCSPSSGPMRSPFWALSSSEPCRLRKERAAGRMSRPGWSHGFKGATAPPRRSWWRASAMVSSSCSAASPRTRPWRTISTRRRSRWSSKR